MRKLLLCIFFPFSLLAQYKFTPYSNVQKFDYYGGDVQRTNQATVLLAAIENIDLTELKKTYNIDTALIAEKARYINQNFRWPEGATAGWLSARTSGKDAWYLRTYYDKLGDKYTYQYQIEVRFKGENAVPSVIFRPKGLVQTIDEPLSQYYRQLRLQAANPTEADPCAPSKAPDELWLADAEKFNKDNNYAAAIVSIDKYIWKNPENAGGYVKKGSYLFLSDKAKESINVLSRGIELSKSETGTTYVMGMFYRVFANQFLRFHKAAITDLLMLDEQYGRVIKLENIYSGLANSYLATKNYKLALTNANIALGIDSTNYDYLKTKAKVFQETNQKDSANIYFDKAMTSAKAQKETINTAIAYVYSDSKNYPAAVEAYKKIAAQKGENYIHRLMGLIETQILNNQPQDALNSIDTLYRDFKTNDIKDKRLTIYFLQAFAQKILKKDTKAAEKLIDQALKTTKEDNYCTCWGYNDYEEWLTKNVSKADMEFVLRLVNKIKAITEPEQEKKPVKLKK